jgi:predicted PhzF superfamily epimerase YddE/YHI9
MRTFIARAFVGDGGHNGNKVSVVLVDGELPDQDTRQSMAAETAMPATVFVAGDHRTVRIHNGVLERPFAGHPLLGTAAVLRSVGQPVERLTTLAGDVVMWRDDAGADWLHAPSAWAPNAAHRQVDSSEELEALTEAPPDEPIQLWAWINEAAGLVRARQFAPSEGTPEDEACGSASMALATSLDRSLTVLHGRGSIIHVHPRDSGVDLGGVCALS